MKARLFKTYLPFLIISTLTLITCRQLMGPDHAVRISKPYRIQSMQTPKWQKKDLEFFLFGSMSSEFIPERVLKALLLTYPELFADGDLTAYGLINAQSTSRHWPIGFSVRKIDHLGGQISVGINCASCHVGEVIHPTSQESLRVLGKPSQFNVYGFLGAVAFSMAQTAKTQNMERFLKHYLDDSQALPILEKRLVEQKQLIAKAIAQDPYGAKGVKAGVLHAISPQDLVLNAASLAKNQDLVPLVRALLRLFHNTRISLHLPDKLPPPVPSIPGPGRTEAFGVLAAAFFHFPAKFDAPVKFGVTWNLENRQWVHWDGNSNDPYVRNLAASLGLGTPFIGQGKLVHFADVKRHTDLSETIVAPRYPWQLDTLAAARGEILYQAQCVSCHNASEDKRLIALTEIGTDPNRARFFNAKQARLFNQWTRSLEVAGFQPPQSSWRSTQKYWAPDLAGVWARAPYLHNGSVRTLWDLLTPPQKRPKTFQIGSRLYDIANMGYEDKGTFVFDTKISGNSNQGHRYGTTLADGEKRDLVEYLRTL